MRTPSWKTRRKAIITMNIDIGTSLVSIVGVGRLEVQSDGLKTYIYKRRQRLWLCCRR